MEVYTYDLEYVTLMMQEKGETNEESKSTLAALMVKDREESSPCLRNS